MTRLFKFSILGLGLFLIGCATAVSRDSVNRSYDPKQVIGRTWRWQKTITPVEKITVINPDHYSLLLRDDGRVQLRIDCNRGGGRYSITEGKLSFGPMMSTRMACPEGSLDTIFMKELQEVNSFFIENGELYLELPADSGTMNFRQQPQGNSD